MSKDGPIEIGWKKELLEDTTENCKDQDRSRSPKRKKENYRRLSDSSTSSSSSSSKRSSSETSSLAGDADEHKRKKREKREKRKAEKKLKKEQKKLEKAQRKELKKAKKEKRKEEKKLKKLAKKSKVKNDSESEDCGVPIDLMFNKARAPETKEEYEKRQSQIRKVEDPETGRTRLIKGDGEVLEEIVSRDRHREINKQATQGDGKFFQSKTVGWKIG